MSDVFVALLVVLCASCARPEKPPEFRWRPEAISARVEVGEYWGQALLLEQALEPGEQGWLSSRLDLPEDWVVSRVAMADREVEIELLDGRRFRVGPSNEPRLAFAIADGASRSRPDDELDSIWVTHALVAP